MKSEQEIIAILSTNEGGMDVEIIDLELYAKEGRDPHGHKYRIRIDKQYFVVSQPSMTGRQLLELAERVPPEKWLLQEKVGRDVKTVGLDEVVHFARRGLERFMTIPNEVTEGEGGAGIRRDFQLTDQDLDFLSDLGLPWEATCEPSTNIRRVVIHDFPIPAGYTVSRASVNVRLDPGYPDTQIDMAYFYPPLVRADGKAINALCDDSYDGKNWQRWSRHRTTGSQWRMGVDNLQTHMALTSSWLAQELQK